MIHFEHINQVIKDMEQSIKFYRAAFPHWQIRARGEGEWYGKPRNWLHYGDDYQYIALNEFGEGKNRGLSGHQVGLAHVAFVTNNLDALVARMKSEGFVHDKEGADEPFRKNIYYIEPDGFEVEFVEYLSDLPEKRNLSS